MEMHAHLTRGRTGTRKRGSVRNFLILLGMLAGMLALYAEAQAAPAFIGVKGCGKCHKKKKDGEQLGIWQKTDHAKAFKTLASKEAKEKAQEFGVKGNPQKAEACLVCHTAGYGEPAKRFKKRFKVSDGVQCESCHGAGSDYRKKKIMKKITKERGKDKKGDSPTAKAKGLVFPNEKTCQRCHAKQIEFKGKVYKNPSYKPFDFKEKFKKIEHPKPG